MLRWNLTLSRLKYIDISIMRNSDMGFLVLSICKLKFYFTSTIPKSTHFNQKVVVCNWYGRNLFHFFLRLFVYNWLISYRNFRWKYTSPLKENLKRNVTNIRYIQFLIQTVWPYWLKRNTYTFNNRQNLWYSIYKMITSIFPTGRLTKYIFISRTYWQINWIFLWSCC